MRDRSLFERLMAADGSPEPVDRTFDESALTESVLHNLSNVLNSRVGSCETRPDYGLPDFNGVVGAVPDAMGQIAMSIRDRIIAFEPRLRDPKVRPVVDPDKPLMLGFQVEARLAGPGDTTISFETVVTDSGQVRLRS